MFSHPPPPGDPVGGFPGGDQGRAQLQSVLGFVEERVPQGGDITTMSRLLPYVISSSCLCPGAGPLEKEKHSLYCKGWPLSSAWNGECDKVCLFLQVWLREPRAGLCHACGTGQQQPRYKWQQAGYPRTLAQPHQSLCHVFMPTAFQVGRWETSVAGFAQVISIFPNPVQKQAWFTTFKDLVIK